MYNCVLKSEFDNNHPLSRALRAELVNCENVIQYEGIIQVVKRKKRVYAKRERDILLW